MRKIERPETHRATNARRILRDLLSRVDDLEEDIAELKGKRKLPKRKRREEEEEEPKPRKVRGREEEEEDDEDDEEEEDEEEDDPEGLTLLG